ncbi:MAG: hypothetical protein MJZ81_07315 [Bacteroidales bacterium]|nr:hypothetical protein [Bacteroidales bacterium]
MEKKDFIKSEVVVIDGRKFATSLIPCDPAHEIWVEIANAFGSSFSTLSFVRTPPETAWKILSFTAAYSDDETWETLESEENRNKFVSNEGTLIQLLLVMCKRNFSFFFDGSLFLWLDLMTGKGLPSSTSTGDSPTRT